MTKDLPSTELCALGAQGTWHFHQVSSRAEEEHLIQSLAGTLARTGFLPADVGKVSHLLEQAFRKASTHGLPPGPETPVSVTYRIAVPYLQVQIDSAPPPASGPTTREGEQTSVRFLLIRGKYALWHEFIGREGQWRATHRRLVR